MLQRRLHKINVFSDLCWFGFLVCGDEFLQNAQCDDVIYCNHCMRHCLCQGFWRSLQLGPDELAIWFVWIQQYKIFDAMVWTIHLCGHLSGRAYTYLHGQCNVDGCLGKRGMKVHRFVPSHRTGCVGIVVNSSTNSLENGRPSLNRFVLDKSHLRMRYGMSFSTFSGSLHSAWSFRRVSMTVEDVFVQNNVCWKLVFGELRNLMWRWWRWFLPFAWQIWNVVYCLCMCMLDNKLQTFFNLVLFQQLCGRELCGDGFAFFTAYCMWATGNCVFEWCMMFFKQRLHGRLFHLRLGWFCCWNLMLQHDARQQIREKDNSTVQRLTDSRTAYFGCFRVLEKGVRARSSHLIWVGLLACFCKLYRHRRCCTDPERRSTRARG